MSKIDASMENTGYRVMDDRAYWFSTSGNRRSPCSAKGVGGMGQIFNPVCWLPSTLQVHHTQAERNFWLVSNDGANFQVARSNQTTLTQVQKSQLNNYAMDRSSVYLRSSKIKDADPESFEVIFPFRDDDTLQQYSFATDRNHLFIDGWAFPKIDLAQIEWVNITCTDEPYKCRTPMIGKAGNDILLFDNGARPRLFPNLGTPDLTCSRREYENYCISNGKRYLIDRRVEEASLVAQPND
ncbi:DKNYY domain-containing protein [Pseudomonas sp. NPDC089395]|uniref:DKNYY domain-containing protein n=1 Tax=Pseudomonas sp. NPDC089395 TaxID=3364460 RepID=UPI00382D83F9